MIFLQVKDKVLEWWKRKNGEYLTESNDFFDQAQQNLAGSALAASTLEYRIKIAEFGISFEQDEIQEQLKNFLTPENSNKQIFNVITEQNTLSAIKVCQILNNIYKSGSYIFMPIDSVLRLQSHVVDAFEGNKNLLVIECISRKNNVDVENLSTELKKVLVHNYKKQKPIYLIISLWPVCK
ncbi:hypothetical protein [Wolbachia endosymbiont of Folsomia candida]|uniref:hypothetical protein n=1 Tax=Wolbachia endosymbiont of Folsomia candida TaxID=169402 RepID=UPI000B5DBAD1|nr:hypothetical protein [Wolbachia endosymbiont of Folsomia candida]APR99048.1 hypothetical protein ASM33_07655 [Wolbachia endosymbiont of Folsomia candida]